MVKIVQPAQVDPVEMADGVFRRTLNSGEDMMIVHVTLRKGSVVPTHSHPHEQVGYVLGGDLTMEIGGETHRLRTADSYLIPGGVEHNAEANKESIVLDIFSPPREEYK